MSGCVSILSMIGLSSMAAITQALPTLDVCCWAEGRPARISRAERRPVRWRPRRGVSIRRLHWGRPAWYRTLPCRVSDNCFSDTAGQLM